VEGVSETADDNGQDQHEDFNLVDDSNQHSDEVTDHLDTPQVVEASHPHHEARKRLDCPEL